MSDQKPEDAPIVIDDPWSVPASPEVPCGSVAVADALRLEPRQIKVLVSEIRNALLPRVISERLNDRAPDPGSLRLLHLADELKLRADAAVERSDVEVSKADAVIDTLVDTRLRANAASGRPDAQNDDDEDRDPTPEEEEIMLEVLGAFVAARKPEVDVLADKLVGEYEDAIADARFTATTRGLALDAYFAGYAAAARQAGDDAEGFVRKAVAAGIRLVDERTHAWVGEGAPLLLVADGVERGTVPIPDSAWRPVRVEELPSEEGGEG